MYVSLAKERWIHINTTVQVTIKGYNERMSSVACKWYKSVTHARRQKAQEKYMNRKQCKLLTSESNMMIGRISILEATCKTCLWWLVSTSGHSIGSCEAHNSQVKGKKKKERKRIKRKQ